MSGLTFRPLTHFELILCILLKNVLISFFFFLAYSCLVFPAPFVKETVLPPLFHCLVFPLCHRLIDHRCMGLFLVFPSCSVDQYFYLNKLTELEDKLMVTRGNGWGKE